MAPGPTSLLERLAPRDHRALVGNDHKRQKFLEWLASRRRRDGEAPCAALLSGPPGTGKTTLARLALGAHGYAVYEVNASDERTGAAIVRAAKRAERSATLAAEGDRRPVAVLLEEIDGVYTAETERHTEAGGLAPLLAYLDDRERTRRLHPLVITCNERRPKAIRALARHPNVLDLLFRPLSVQSLLEIARPVTGHALDGFTLATARRCAEQAHGDVRQLFHALQLLRTMRALPGRAAERGAERDCALNAFDATERLLAGYGGAAPQRGTKQHKVLVANAALAEDTFAGDPALAVAVLHENFLERVGSAVPGPLGSLRSAASFARSLSDADLLTAGGAARDAAVTTAIWTAAVHHGARPARAPRVRWPRALQGAPKRAHGGTRPEYRYEALQWK